MPTNAYVIVVAGKGGVGKTTLTALLFREIIALLLPPKKLLLVDGDPDQTLAQIMGLPSPASTIEDIRELDFSARRLREEQLSAADMMEKRMKELKVIQQCTSGTGDEFDFMAMGRPRGGPSCYCAVNNALAQVFDSLLPAYDLILVDSPAGTEHLNRHRIKTVDTMIIINNGTRPSLTVAQQVEETARRTGTQIGQVIHVTNNQVQREDHGLHIPHSSEIPLLEGAGESILNSRDHQLKQSINGLANNALQQP